MSEHRVTIRWQNDSEKMAYDEFSRDHLWTLKGGKLKVPASAAPDYLGNSATADPEDALVAALSACHMLTFLAIAAKKRLVVQSYADDAVGTLDRNAEGRIAITTVVLKPVVNFAPGTSLSHEDFAKIHEKAHANCFIANSVKCEVRIEPVMAASTPG